MGIETGLGLLIGGLASAGGSVATGVIASKAQSSASKRAATAAEKANDEALEFERQQEAERKAEWDQTQLENRRQYDLASLRDQQLTYETLADRRRSEGREVERWNSEQERRQPYRDTSWAAVQQLAKTAGLTVTRTEAPQNEAPPPSPTMAELRGYQ
jgi:hypothetical protein